MEEKTEQTLQTKCSFMLKNENCAKMIHNGLVYKIKFQYIYIYIHTKYLTLLIAQPTK